jgi:hypothetical protein
MTNEEWLMDGKSKLTRTQLWSAIRRQQASYKSCLEAGVDPGERTTYMVEVYGER